MIQQVQPFAHLDPFPMQLTKHAAPNIVDNVMVLIVNFSLEENLSAAQELSNTLAMTMWPHAS
jgi:hypothetical protein